MKTKLKHFFEYLSVKLMDGGGRWCICSHSSERKDSFIRYLSYRDIYFNSVIETVGGKVRLKLDSGPYMFGDVFDKYSDAVSALNSNKKEN